MAVKDKIVLTIESRGFNVVVTADTEKHGSKVHNFEIEAKVVEIVDKRERQADVNLESASQ